MRRGRWTSRLAGGLITGVAVLGIVAGSALGLDAWADGVATHVASPPDSTAAPWTGSAS